MRTGRAVIEFRADGIGSPLAQELPFEKRLQRLAGAVEADLDGVAA